MKMLIKLATITALLLAALPLQAADVEKLGEAMPEMPRARWQRTNQDGRQAGVKDYTDPKVQAEMKDENAVKTIKEGIVEKGKKKMDPYKDKLSDDEIKALIAYMRAFKK